ncbi:MAG TPA: cytochrome c [Thermoanaerobaculia bacterium]|nr:cytochrome c [Thermoanaerobaculia bacterium]
MRLLPLCLLLAALAGVAGTAGCSRKNLTTPELYADSCARCHGDRGEGVPRALTLYPRANLLASPMALRGDRAAVRERIAEGHGPMPGFKRRLDPQEVERLVDYTIQLSHPGHPGHPPKETP